LTGYTLNILNEDLFLVNNYNLNIQILKICYFFKKFKTCELKKSYHGKFMLELDKLFEKKYGDPQKIFHLISEIENSSEKLKLSPEQVNDIISELINFIG